MATQIPEPIIDPVWIQINQSIDRLILSLEQRRVQLLTDLRDIREEMREDQVLRQQMAEQQAETNEYVERQIKHNKLHSMQGRMVRDLEAKMAELQMATPPPQELKFLCDMQDLEEHIARLGEIVRFEIPSLPLMTALPEYLEFQEFDSVEYASAPRELNLSRGVSIEAESGHIYVEEWGNSRIQIFSET